MVALTKLECKGIEGIVKSEYGEGAVNKCVWTWSANKFGNKATFSGVISSLSKKGCVEVCEDGKDSTLTLTAAGWAAYKAAPAEFKDPKIDVAKLDEVDAYYEKEV
jgi:hypothetical protein